MHASAIVLSCWAGFLHGTVTIVAMIYFQTKPDAVFEAILKEAFASEASEIQLLSEDCAIDSWEGLYPETSRRLCPYEAVRVLVQLLVALNDSQVYRLTDLHWLVLYETLKNFCTTHNDLLDDFDQHARPIGDYNIGRVDGDALVDVYFWDTDFLLSNKGETWGDRQAGTPRQRDGRGETQSEQDATIPALEPVRELGWIVKEPQEYFRAGSTRYPDHADRWAGNDSLVPKQMDE